MTGLLLSLAVMAWALVGCNSPEMRDARETRERALARSAGYVASLDDRRDEQMAKTGRIIAERHKLDQQLIRRDMTRIDRFFRDEFEDWAEKEPAYRRGIEHQFEGDNASIERTAPHFVY